MDQASGAEEGNINLRDCVLGRALCAISTSNQWSLPQAVVTKLNKVLPRDQRCQAEDLCSFLQAFEQEHLAVHGVFLAGVSPWLIICVNPVYRRARQQEHESNSSSTCTCPGLSEGNNTARYFTSQDYNAGRHGYEACRHRAFCIDWRPPTAGHLHSWRRGFQPQETRVNGRRRP